MAQRLGEAAQASTVSFGARSLARVVVSPEATVEEAAFFSPENRNSPPQSLEPANAPTRPNGSSARSDAEQVEFTTAAAPVPAHTPERTSVLDSGTAPEDHYGDADGAPIGPSEEEEAAFLANEQSSTDFIGAASLSRVGEEATTSAIASASRIEVGVNGTGLDEKVSGPLPSLEDLRGRISPEVLGLMEELFRAKLTRVTRVNKRDLKGAKHSP